MTDKDIKNLKINYIDIQDFKNIEGISTELYDWNIIGGYNGNGKSSFVEAILTAIIGHKFFGNGAISPGSLVSAGENKAVIKLLIKGEESEIVLERIFKAGTKRYPNGDSKLKAEINGEKISQTKLNQLLNTLTLDPMMLGSLSIKEQIQEIKTTTGLNTDDIDKEIEDQTQLTKESRALKTQSIAVFDKLVAGGVPDKVEKVNINDLLKIQDYFNKIADKKTILDDKINTYQDKKDKIKKIEDELILMKKDLQDTKESGLAYKESFEKEKEEFISANGTEEENNEALRNTESNNSKADKYSEYQKLKQEKNNNLDCFKKDEEKLAELRGSRIDIISKSNLPEYMEISDEYGILVDSVEYKLLNTARKIEVAIDLVLISGSPLRMIRIEQGGELDIKTLDSIKEKILKHDFQIFIERPVIDKFDSIIISDGELLEGVQKDDFINNQ